MKSSVEIALARPADADALSGIAIAAKAHWGYPADMMDRWRKLLTILPEFIENNPTFVAREGGRAVGFFALRKDGEKLILEHLWVLPDAMRRGIGAKLFRRAQQAAAEMEFDALEWLSDPNASGFYERMGAKQIGIHSTELLGQRRETPIFRGLTRTGDQLTSSTERQAFQP